MKNGLILLLVLCFGALAFAVPREWTRADDDFTGVPPANSVAIDVVKIGNGLLHLRYTNPNVKMEQVLCGKREWTRVSMDGETRLWQDGKPSLPMISRAILLPNHGKIGLRILSAEYREVDNVDVMPEQNVERADENGKIIDDPFYFDAAAYARDAWFPQDIAFLTDPAIMRDARLTLLAFQPVQYNPVQRKLRIYTDVEFETESLPGATINELNDPPRPVPGFASLYSEILGADELTETNATAMPGLVLIVAKQGLHSQIQPYVDWRIRAGRPTQLVTPQGNGNNTANVQAPITAAYTANNPPLETVIIVGDGGTSGDYLLEAPSFSGYNSDHPYSQLVGNDLLADIFCGRWSIDNQQNLQTIINRTFNYERTPNMADTLWYRRAWGYAGTSHNTTSNPTGIRFALEQCVARGVRDTLFDTHSGTVDQALITSRMSPGATFWPHRVGYLGEMNTSHVSGITNANKCWVGMNISCSTGSWYGAGAGGIHEAVTRLGTPTTPYGGIASVSTATSGTHPAYNICMAIGTFYALAKNAMMPGEMYWQGKFQLWRNYVPNDATQAANFTSWNTPMGDMACRMWTGVPRRLTATIPSTISLGTNRIAFTLRKQLGGAPAPNALVTVSKNSSTGTVETYYRTTSDSSGNVFIPLTNVTTGQLYLTVTTNTAGQNYHPIVDTIDVVQSTRDVALSGVTILDDNTNGRVGNGNGQANPGETTDFNIRLSNLGTSALGSSITGTLSTTDSRIQITSATHGWTSLNAGDSAFADGMFRVRFLAGLRHNEVIPLQLAITSTDTNLNRLVNIPVTIKSISMAFQSYTLYNRTGGTITSMNPGDTAWVAVTSRNNGAVDPGTTIMTMFSRSPYIAVMTPEASVTSLPVGSNVTNPATQRFAIIANRRTTRGTMVALSTAYNSNAFGDTANFTFTIGTRLNTDPTGPDGYGYVAYDNTDSDTLVRPTFNWVDIVSTANRLNMTDPSEGTDVNLPLRLPFSARYYGRSYDSITVCTNAFIAFGWQRHYTNMRPWRLPAQEGPRNLVAVAWQDVLVSSSPQGVYAWYDQPNGKYIITWSGTLNFATTTPLLCQLIIYNPAMYPTPTGDSKLLFQYRNYAATTGSLEVGYATIGIVDSTYTNALEYTFWNSWAPGATSMSTGTNTNRAILFTTEQRFIVGHLEGVVRRVSDSTVVPDANVVLLNGGLTARTDSLGHYSIRDIQIGDYQVRSTKQGFNAALGSVHIGQDTTSTLNLYMTAPGFAVTTSQGTDSLFSRLAVTGDTTHHRIFFQNTGNGQLTWNSDLIYSGVPGSDRNNPNRGPVNAGNLDEVDNPWDEVFSFNASSAVNPTTPDAIIQGVEFDGVNFWATGANNYNGTPMLYKLDATGHLVRSIAQVDAGGGSSLGWRDLAWDGHYLYASMGRNIDKIDTSTGAVVRRYPISMSPARAIAIDTANGVMYFADQVTSIYKVRLSDSTSLGQLGSPGNVYGLAWWDADPDGFKLYAICRDSTSRRAIVKKIDPSTGATMAVANLGAANENGYGVAITSRWNPMLWTLITVLDNNAGTPNDRIALYELAFNTRWIQYTPHSGTIEAGQRDSVDVRLSSYFMPLGRYHVALRFTTNAAVQSVSVPVTMVVEPTGAAGEPNTTLPKQYALYQNYPNPFNPTTSISFVLPKAERVTLTVHNSLGQEVTTLLADATMASGKHSITFNAEKLAGGVYFYRIEAGSYTATRKMVLLK